MFLKALFLVKGVLCIHDFLFLLELWFRAFVIESVLSVLLHLLLLIKEFIEHLRVLRQLHKTESLFLQRPDLIFEHFKIFLVFRIPENDENRLHFSQDEMMTDGYALADFVFEHFRKGVFGIHQLVLRDEKFSPQPDPDFFFLRGA